MKRRIISSLIIFFVSCVLFFPNRARAQASFEEHNPLDYFQNITGVNVGTSTKDAQTTVTDFDYYRNGFPMKFERYFHNGISSPLDELGDNWMSNYDLSIQYLYNVVQIGTAVAQN